MDQEIPCSLKNINDWDEAKTIFKEIPTGWAFRGQSKSSWTLKTSLERAEKSLLIADAEEFLYHEFKRRAHNYLRDTVLPKTTAEWLALMQHYGTPTRLLDWTMSPYVASYFALEEAKEKKDSCAVWAANLSWFKGQGMRNIQVSAEFSTLDDTADLSRSEYFDEIFFRKRVRLVIPIEPYLMNERFAIQQGAFLCIGNVEQGFVGNLLSYDDIYLTSNLVKIVIPNELRTAALEDLNRMNINRATLFPGIDGFAQSLKHRLLFPMSSWDNFTDLLDRGMP